MRSQVMQNSRIIIGTLIKLPAYEPTTSSFLPPLTKPCFATTAFSDNTLCNDEQFPRRQSSPRLWSRSTFCKSSSIICHQGDTMRALTTASHDQRRRQLSPLTSCCLPIVQPPTTCVNLHALLQPNARMKSIANGQIQPISNVCQASPCAQKARH